MNFMKPALRYLLLLLCISMLGCETSWSPVGEVPQQEVNALLQQARTAPSPEAAADLAQQALTLARQYSQTDELPKIWNTIGYYKYEASQYNEALVAFLSALAGSEDLPNHKAYAQLHIGRVYQEVNLFKEATSYLQKAQAGYNRLDKPFELATTNFHLGKVHLVAGNYDAAHKALTDGVTLTKQQGYSSLRRLMLNTLIEVSIVSENFEQADGYAKQLIQQFPNMPSEGLALYRLRQAKLAHLQGQNYSARAFYTEAIDLLTDNPEGDLYLYGHAAYADYLIAQGQTQQAITLLEQALQLNDQETYSPELRHIYKTLVQHYKDAGQTERAFGYLQKLEAIGHVQTNLVENIQRNTEVAQLQATSRAFTQQASANEGQVPWYLLLIVGALCALSGLLVMLPRTQHKKHQAQQDFEPDHKDIPYRGVNTLVDNFPLGFDMRKEE